MEEAKEIRMQAEGAVGTPEWAEKTKSREAATGEMFVKHPVTGFLEKSSGLGFTSDKKVRFLEEFAKDDLTIGEICKVLEINRTTLYRHIAVDFEFKKQYIEIDEGHTDAVEKKLRDNAKRRDMASAERIFYLKKKRPQIYADRIQIEAPKDKDIVQELASRLGNYQLIPRDSIVELKSDGNGTDQTGGL